MAVEEICDDCSKPEIQIKGGNAWGTSIKCPNCSRLVFTFKQFKKCGKAGNRCLTTDQWPGKYVDMNTGKVEPWMTEYSVCHACWHLAAVLPQKCLLPA